MCIETVNELFIAPQVFQETLSSGAEQAAGAVTPAYTTATTTL